MIRFFFRNYFKAFIALLVCFYVLPAKGYSQNIGFILIKSNPSGAEVLIDGESTLKKTPFQIQLDEGTYKVALKYDMYHTYEETLKILRGQTVTKDIVLKPAFGKIKIESDPQDASIKLDGVLINQKTNAILPNIPSGKHTIILSKDMYSESIQDVIVTDQQTAEIFRELEADYGTIGIVTKPMAIIIIDGNRVDSGNYAGRLSPGIHNIALTREKYYPFQQEIDVVKGQEEKLNIQLKPIIGGLSVMVDPPETEIYLNSKYYGVSPKIIDSLMIGEYNIDLKKEGFALSRQNITIEEDKIFQINTALQEGKLIKITSSPVGAEIIYNGVNVGTTPSELVVGNGQNRIILRRKYYTDKEVTINAQKNDQLFDFKLDVDRKLVNIGIQTNPNRALITLKGIASLESVPYPSASKTETYSSSSPLNLQIPVGNYNVKVEKNKFKTFQKDMFIDKEESFKFNLEPLKYRNKGSALLLSVLWPGAGQSYLNRGSAHFVMGFAGYGAVAYFIYQYSMIDESNTHVQLARYAEFAGIAIWGVNFIWTLAMPSEAKKYKNINFSLLESENGSIPVLGWRSAF